MINPSARDGAEGAYLSGWLLLVQPPVGVSVRGFRVELLARVPFLVLHELLLRKARIATGTLHRNAILTLDDTDLAARRATAVFDRWRAVGFANIPGDISRCRDVDDAFYSLLVFPHIFDAGFVWDDDGFSIAGFARSARATGKEQGREKRQDHFHGVLSFLVVVRLFY